MGPVMQSIVFYIWFRFYFIKKRKIIANQKKCMVEARLWGQTISNVYMMWWPWWWQCISSEGGCIYREQEKSKAVLGRSLLRLNKMTPDLLVTFAKELSHEIRYLARRKGLYQSARRNLRHTSICLFTIPIKTSTWKRGIYGIYCFRKCKRAAAICIQHQTTGICLP